MSETNEQAIDYVITWVDGNDPVWQAQYKEYKGIAEEDFEFRYRDWGLLKYWFRSVEKNAPWVRKIHFVTCGHVPSWLDTTNKKLHIVKHEDYIPSEYLPTFNSNVIELFFHRIEGLSEHFVYFNDDCFCLNYIPKEYFFKSGKPVGFLSFEPICAYSYEMWGYFKLNDSVILGRHFNKIADMKKNTNHYFSFKYPLKYRLYNFVELFFPSYTSFIQPHNPFPVLKSVYERVWECEGKSLEITARNRFRNKADNTSRVFELWNMLEGNFVPANPYKYFRYFVIGRDDDKIVDSILGNRIKTACINDGSFGDDIDFEKSGKKISDAFALKFPDKSSFEKE